MLHQQKRACLINCSNSKINRRNATKCSWHIPGSSKMLWYFASERHNSSLIGGCESDSLDILHSWCWYKFPNITPVHHICATFSIYSMPSYWFLHSYSSPNSLSLSFSSCFFTETYTLWRFSPVVSRIKMTGRKSEGGGGLVKSFLAACSISLYESVTSQDYLDK